MAKIYEISIDNIMSGKDKDDLPMANPYTFVVKPYQRGYRWEPTHINHLIEDLFEFENEVNENGQTLQKKYCLQPIIVKELDAVKNEWELVDGQQRSISLWLMKRVCSWFRFPKKNSTADDCYTLQFEGKPELSTLVAAINRKFDGTNPQDSPFTFLQNMFEEKDNPDYLYDCFGISRGRNIDVDCMMECLKAILLYEHPGNPDIGIVDILNNIFSATSGKGAKAKNILVVWYELDNSGSAGSNDVITVFSNINANKIKLTESELIKAQILYNLRGMDQKDEEAAKIAYRWEEIERILCDDDFWYFLNAGEGRETGTRIDFLFEVWSKIDDPDDGCIRRPEDSNKKKSDYPLSDLVEYTFKQSANKPNTAHELWVKICGLLDILSDWKNDYYFYHMIGLIISVNKIMSKSTQTAADIIRDCIREYRQVSSKEEFKFYLKGKVREQMFALIPAEEYSEKNFYSFVQTIENLTYDDNTDKGKILIVLLMHNIASLINAQNEHERFPFELFFTDHYDIEHVNPQNPDEENLEALKEWYRALQISYNPQAGAAQLLSDAKNHMRKEKLHRIGNLVLLDENTNRSYKNIAFFEKRRDIIDILRTGKRKKADNTTTEKYIPIGTKWVFLKAFSDLSSPKDASVKFIWDEKGREAYKRDIITQLWILQSGLRVKGKTIAYYEYEKGLTLREIGLVLDESGKYYFLKWNDTQTALVNMTGSIEIDANFSNGLVPEGKYKLTDGQLVKET